MSVGRDGVVPLFVLDESLLKPAGSNRRRFLAESLRALDMQLGGTLVLRRGAPPHVVPELAAEVGAGAVMTTADFGPYGAARDQSVGEALSATGRKLLTVDSPYIVAPGTVRGSSGSPLQVFTPFFRTWKSIEWERPLPTEEVRLIGAPSDAVFDDIEADVVVPNRSALPQWWEGLPLGVAERLPKAGSSAGKDRLENSSRGSSRATQKTATDWGSPARPDCRHISALGASIPGRC